MKKAILLCLVMASFGLTLTGQRKTKKKNLVTTATESTHHQQFNDSLFSGLQWRNIGPHRGGRSTTATGVNQDINTYYMGSTGGGVWKTSNGGATWQNVSDGFFNTGSVGAIDVSDSDPSVVVVGMGEAPVRGVMTSHGDGVYISHNAGKSWKHIGLENTRHISKVIIHPNHPEIIYVAAQGSPYMPTEDRGIYRSKDGGATWDKVHYVDSISGVSSLTMDPDNPRILFAAYWDHQRHPWIMRSGGPGSSIWKSEDGGDSWTQLSTGLPKGVMGKIGISASGGGADRVYAIIEADDGGLYRSDDGGNTWKLINSDRILRARSWYYMHVFADPVDPDKVVVLNAPFNQSLDGGKTFVQIPTPHGDNHDLWVNPLHPEVMINANDGGANISYNNGKNWSIQSNQPTAQFYRVNADNQFPYRVYGGQQDNSTVSIASQVSRGGITNQDFYPVGGCESAFCAFDPDNPRYVYAGCYQGIISEYDTKLKERKDIMAYPILGLGTKPLDQKYRFNWNAPIHVSMHDPSIIYHCGQVVLQSKDRGISWKELSPDLTDPDSSKLDYGGGPITREGAGGEVYHTIMYFAESPHDPNVLYTGSDDGMIHMTRDGGSNWVNVTPPGLGEGMINSIEVSPHDQSTAYAVFNRYKFNDFRPRILVTQNYGEDWKEIQQGIAPEDHVRVVREDSEVRGLLFAGTETGLYISIDGGDQWSRFQLNLPVVPITDLKVHQDDLIAATQGRAFWILDKIQPLRIMAKQQGEMLTGTWKPSSTTTFGGRRNDKSLTTGSNPDFGMVQYYWLEHDSSDVSCTIRSSDGMLIQSAHNKQKANPIPTQKGLNKWVWDLTRRKKGEVKGLFSFGGFGGAQVMPGTYHIEMVIDGDTTKSTFELMPDPRLELTLGDYKQHHDWQEKLDTAIRSLYQDVNRLTSIKRQVSEFVKRPGVDSSIIQEGKSIITEIDSVDALLVQRDQKTFQDVINYPNQLDANLKAIENSIGGSHPPLTQGQKQRAQDVLSEWNDIQIYIEKTILKKVEAFNASIQKAELPYISIE